MKHVDDGKRKVVDGAGGSGMGGKVDEMGQNLTRTHTPNLVMREWDVNGQSTEYGRCFSYKAG